MSEEEKKAMEFLRLNSIGEYKRNENGSITHMIAVEDFKKILCLIERQQKEINVQTDLVMRLHEQNQQMKEKIDKIITIEEDVNIESYNELVECFLEIRKILESGE